MFFRVFEMKFTWGKQMIHVEQKNILKNRERNLAKATNENSISINASNDTSKKTATLKKRDSISKNQANTVYCEFYYDFGWFSMDFEEKQAKRGQFYCVKTD